MFYAAKDKRSVLLFFLLPNLHKHSLHQKLDVIERFSAIAIITFHV
jgi:hypothetical protein